MFTFYRQKGCLFECKVRYSANRTGCTPWDFPVPKELSTMKFCNGQDLLKFNQFMDYPISHQTCDCLPDCEEVTFETQVSTNIICHLCQ